MSSNWVSNESRILCACARTQLSPEDDAGLADLLARPVDWNALFTLGRRHRMIPFLHTNFKRLGEGGVPGEVSEKLRSWFEQIASRNLLMTAALVRVLKKLNHDGIPVLAFKGPVSSYSLYGNLGLREFNDVDVIVHKNMLHRARRTLLGLGLQSATRLSENQERALSRFRNELSFSMDDGVFHVDLHWHLLVHHLRTLPDDEDVWRRSERVNLAGVGIRTLSATDLLSYFCARAAVDMWTTLCRIFDIAETARVLSVDGWSDVLTRADRVGKRRMMLVGLLVAHDLLNAPVPAKIINEAYDIPPVVQMATRARSDMFRSDYQFPGPIVHNLCLVAALDTVRERLRFLSFLPFSPGPHDIAVADLPERLWFLYRLIRVIRGSFKWIKESIIAIRFKFLHASHAL